MVGQQLRIPAALAAALLLAGPASAQAPVEPTPPATEPAPAAFTISGKPGKGVTFEQKGSFRLTLKGRFHALEVVSEDDDDVTTESLIRRARLGLGGYVFDEDIGYDVELGFAGRDLDEDGSPVLNAFVTLSHLRDLELRAGQFKVPFDRANVTSSSGIQFVDRAPVVGDLSIDRDVGVAAFSKDLFGLDGKLLYSVGVFGGEGRGRQEAPAGFLYVARLETQPLGAFNAYQEADLERSSRPRLAVAGSVAWNENAIRPRGNRGGALDEELELFEDFDGFDYLHLEADTTFKWYGFSLLAEFLWRDERGDGAFTGTAEGEEITIAPENGWGWFAQAGQMLAPEWEVVARYSEQNPMGGSAPSVAARLAESGRALGGGVNWYAYGHTLKLQADYFRTWGVESEGVDARSFGDGANQVRLQLGAIF